jgi:NADH-quinone oxidoreductase subunit M
MGLNRLLPFAAVTFTVAGVASMGLPGFSGFVAELQVLIGAWHMSPTLAVVAGLGILVGVAYTLRALQEAFFSDNAKRTDGHATESEGHSDIQPISVPERFGAAILVCAALVIGLFPRLLLDHIVPCFDSPLFAGLRKAGLL